MRSTRCRARSGNVSTPDTAELGRLLAERQADRLPSVAAAVVRDGEVAWAGAVGSADFDEDREATPDTQYRIGSITKTFTATAIMQLRAAGELDLDDRLEQHGHGGLVVRRDLRDARGKEEHAAGQTRARPKRAKPKAERCKRSTHHKKDVWGLGPAAARGSWLRKEMGEY